MSTRPFRPHKGWLLLPTWLLVLGTVLVLAAVAAVTVLGRNRDWQGVDHTRTASPDLLQKASQASRQARVAEEFLRKSKTDAGIKLDPGLTAADPAWLGCELTPLVTTLGSLEAKRLAAEPEWARVLTLRLYQAGVRPNSVVAAGCSGSFPALNLALACACQALGAELVAVSSVTASTWGANQPGFTWPEIESRLVRAQIIRPVSVGISIGGAGDAAGDLEPAARQLAQRIQREACAALGATPLVAATLPEAVEQRLELYRRAARGRPILLYVNVGGTEASLGDSAAVLRLQPGFIPAKPFDLSPRRGVIARFAESGVPTLSLLNIEGLALKWGLTL
jgi:poly-gamma-glutamate system protein